MSRKKIWSAPLALIVVVTMALFFGGITVSADEVDSGTCGENVTWSLDDNGTLTISGTGEMEAYVRDGEFPDNTEVPVRRNRSERQEEDTPRRRGRGDRF